jgi:hypothetical protein
MGRPGPAIALALLLAAYPAAAQSPAPGDWALSSDQTRPLKLPLRLEAESMDLDYDTPDSVSGLMTDLNGDGTPDFVLRSALSLCGASGNCPFAIVDGATQRVLGHPGGNRLYFRGRRINGWPVIQSWWHMSASSGLYSTWVFDGTAYVDLASVPVEGEGLEHLFTQLDSVPAAPR